MADNPYDPNPGGGITGRVAQGETKAHIDQVNSYMRSQPWYQQILQQYGGNARSDGAKRALTTAAQQHGVVIDEGHFEMDDSGNLRGKGHALRNTLIVVGIAAATIATMGAAGVFAAAGAPGVAGTVGATGAGVSAGAGAGTGALASTAIGTGAVGGISAASTGTAAGLAGTMAGAGGAGALTLAGHGASSWLGSLAAAKGIEAGAGLVGAYMKTRADTKAAELQKQSTDAALAYEKEQDAYKRATEAERYGYSRATEANRYGAMSGALRPYVGGGGAAESRMAELLGLPPSSSSTPPQGPSGPPQGPPGGPSRYGIGAPAPPQHGPASGPPGASEMVLMRAPDGTTKQVPASEIDHWTRLGATVVGGQA